MWCRGVWVVGLAALVGCGGEEGGGELDPCDPAVDACVIEHTVSTVTVPAGVEDEDTCQSWTLHNAEELWVNGVSQSNDGGYHHANWFFVPDDQFDLPDGTWSCSEQGFSELDAALLGGYLFALSTQSAAEAQALPSGSAIRIPPYSRVIGSSHLLNTAGTDVTTRMRLSLATIPPSAVKAKMAPARIEYRDLAIDPMATSSFTTECALGQTYEDIFEDPLDYVLHYVTGHYHELGAYLELAIVGGERDGEVLMRHEGYGENFGVAFEPPLDLGAVGASGLRFTCAFENPRNEVVGWGIGDQEMCVIALQAASKLAFDADMVSGQGAVLGTGADGEIQHAGPCSVLGFPWDFEKPGAPRAEDPTRRGSPVRSGAAAGVRAASGWTPGAMRRRPYG